MPIHHPMTYPAIMVLITVGSVLSMIAARHSSGPWFVPLWSRKRDCFTDTGWRYRSWSLWCGYAAIAVAAVDQLLL